MKNPKIKTGCFVNTETITALTEAQLISVFKSYADEVSLGVGPFCTRLGLIEVMSGKTVLAKAMPNSRNGQKLTNELRADEVLYPNCNQQDMVSFDSLNEFVKWLVDNEGKKLVSKEGKFVYFDSTQCSPFRLAHTSPSGGNLLGTLGRWWNETYTIYREPKEPEWFECIPEGGVLCFVSDRNEHEGRVTKRLRVVTSYDKEARRPFRAQLGWSYAVPAKPEEVPFLSQI